MDILEKLEKIIQYEIIYQKDLKDLGRAPSAQDYLRLFTAIENLRYLIKNMK